MELQVDGLEILTEDECRALASTAVVGRVAVSIGALPAVFPVNFALLDGDVVFATSEGTKLHAATSGAVVAFEVDRIDDATRSGWSVLIVGRSEEVTDPVELVRVAELDLRPWAPGDRHRVVRVRSELCSGRRIAEGAPGGRPAVLAS